MQERFKEEKEKIAQMDLEEQERRLSMDQSTAVSMSFANPRGMNSFV